MHTVTELETSVPAFLGKLWKLVEDPETDDLICWSPTGRSFFIRNTAQFARELLPHYYKHNNMASFVRQLNMYGFHKKVSVELGGLKCDRDEMEFAHQYFIKGHPYLLEHIKRKIATKSQDPNQPMRPEIMNKVLTEVRTMRGRQEHLDTRLGAMKRENEALWRELAMLRRKHLKQQEIVNKLIHFLVTLVQPGRGGGLPVKRRYPLMIDDRQRSKHAKMSKPEASPPGPVIHELDGEQDLDSQYIVAEMLENQAPAIQSPASIEPLLDDDNTETVYHIADDTVDREIRILEAQEAAAKKRLGLKPKKKEETLFLDVNPEESVLPIALLENNIKQNPKPIPLKTVRSSKLTAMAANINKLNSEDSDEVDDSRDQNPDVDLDNLIIPEVTMQEGDQRVEENGNRENEVANEQERQLQTAFEGNQSDAGSSDRSRDLTLSCVNSSGALGSAEEIDNHLETMQTDIDNLRDVLRGEGYIIDANTLLGLFPGDDPMSFGIPMNPELDPTQRERDGDDHMGGTNPAATGGELMAYNPSSSLLDFDDDIFLGASSPSMNTSLTNQNTTQNFYNPDPLDLGDNKAALLEALIAGHNANSSTSS